MNDLPNPEAIAAGVVAMTVMLMVIYAAIRSGRRATDMHDGYMPLAMFNAEAAADILAITWAAAGFDAVGYLSVTWDNTGLLTIKCSRGCSTPPYFSADVTRKIYCFELTRAVDYCLLLSDMHAELFKLVHARAQEPHQRYGGRSPQPPS